MKAIINLMYAKIVQLYMTGAASGITLKPFDAHDLIITIVDWISAIIILVGVIGGGFMIATGSFEDSPARKKTGLEILITCILVGAGMLTIVNLVI